MREEVSVITAPRDCREKRGNELLYRYCDNGFRVQGSGFRVQGSGFRVQGSGKEGNNDRAVFKSGGHDNIRTMKKVCDSLEKVGDSVPKSSILGIISVFFSRATDSNTAIQQQHCRRQRLKQVHYYSQA